MRKIFLIALVLAIANTSMAEHAKKPKHTSVSKYVKCKKGEFEMGGAINTGFGFQYNNINGQNGVLGSGATFNNGAAANPYGPVGAGPLGEFNKYATTPAGAYGRTSFEFYTDGVQLFFSKVFADRTRARADLVFGSANYGGSVVTTGAPIIAQAYVTVDIHFRKGVEFLVGHFFVPFGYENVFRNENNTATHSVVWSLRPTTFTGVKFYYNFKDRVDLHIYGYNNMRDNLGASVSKDMPGYGVTLGLNWGEEGKRSRVVVSGLIGPESTGNLTGGVSDKTGHWTYMGDVSWNWHASDLFTFGGEGLYRVDGANVGTPKSRVIAGVIDLNYVFNEAWDGTFKLAYAHQNNVTATGGSVEALTGPLLASGGLGLRNNVVQSSISTQLHLSDSAKLQMEFRFDYAKAKNAVLPDKALNYGPILNFAYAF